MKRFPNWPVVTLAVAMVLGCARWSSADDNPPDARPASEESNAGRPANKADVDAAAKKTGTLATEQGQVADKYRELEKVLIRMAELTASTDPRRAALLRQAVAQSKDRYIDGQFDKLVDLLKEDRLSIAVKDQDQLRQDLARLLELLLSEDRNKHIESEKMRIRDYLKRVNKIIKDQKEIASQTDRDGDTRKLANNQGELAEKTGGLAKDIQTNEGGAARPAERERNKQSDKNPPKDDKPPKSDDRQPDDDQPKPDAPKSRGSEKDQKDNQKGEPGAPGKPGDEQGKGDRNSKPNPSQDGKSPSDGQPGQPNSESSDTPPPGQEQHSPQKRLAQATERMQDAQRKLEEAKRTEARDKQEEALRALEQAKADLEEILRQLREEEMARTLAALEARVRKMLDMQVEVFEGTKRVDRVPESDRDRDDEIEAGRLSRREAEIVAEADKALSLLREEGSAVAFPEAFTDIREDMEQVVVRLAQAKVGDVTQAVEQDIIKALEEMITALKKAQKDLENKAKNAAPGGEMMEPPLVDPIAELKMIRSLQMRINERTKRYGQMINAEQADKPELISALKRLAEREERIHRVTRDIVVGRNR